MCVNSNEKLGCGTVGRFGTTFENCQTSRPCHVALEIRICRNSNSTQRWRDGAFLNVVSRS